MVLSLLAPIWVELDDNVARGRRRTGGERRIAAQTTLAADSGRHKAGAPVTWVALANCR